ncbi:MAG: fumarylacetoacetate hydrolase family protein [Pseudomonadales bacterium]|nr:fumarylacetoacetate hydrolase family protein [Pseudomonadales bacterium]
MKLVTYEANGTVSIGLLSENGVTDLPRADTSLPATMAEFLHAGEEALDKARRISGNGVDYPHGEYRLLAPLARPPKILAIGLNYRAHAEESGSEIPVVPLVFTKQSTSATGPFDDVWLPAETQMLDYEGELGIVIGKRCRRVPRERAHEVVAGYCVVNDVSVRNWQLRGKPPQFTMGKSWDTHCPFGPAIVTPDEVDPHTLGLRTLVNGEIRQNSNTDDLIFNCWEIIEFLSTAFTLEVGDLIVTGTPSGVGMAMKPPQSLKAGDIVRVEIDGLGAIENPIVTEPDVALI